MKKNKTKQTINYNNSLRSGCGAEQMHALPQIWLIHGAAAFILRKPHVPTANKQTRKSLNSTRNFNFTKLDETDHH